MLSDRLYFMLKLGIPLLCFFGCYPFTFDGKKRVFRRSPHGRRYLRLNIAYVACALLYHIILEYRLRKQGNINDFNVSFLTFSTMLGIVQAPLMFLLYEDEFLVGMNGFNQFLHKINREYLTDYDRNRSLRSLLIDFGVLCVLGWCGLFFLVTSLCCLMFPRTVIFYGYMIPKHWPDSLLFVFGCLPSIYLIGFLVATLSIISCMIYMYGVFAVPFIVRDLNLNRNKTGPRAALRKPMNLIIAYRAVQILHEVLVSTICRFLVPTQAIAGNIVVVSVYMVIRYRNELEHITHLTLGIWGLGATASWCLVLWLGGYLYFHGLKVHRSWKGQKDHTKREQLLMEKFRKSCKPMVISFNNTYVIRKLSVLNFLRSLNRGIFKVLLSL